MAIGLGVGAIIGIALDNTADWTIIGAIFGVGLGTALIISTQHDDKGRDGEGGER